MSTTPLFVQSEEISKNVLEWIKELDYGYMVLIVLIAYGLKYKEQLQWVVKIFKGTHWKATWILGFFLGIPYALTENIFFNHDGEVHWVQLLILFQSYLITMIFCDDLVTMLKRWHEIFKNKNKDIGH